jgi:16S rRNA (guanine966-N2)-methyltransferase
MGGGRGNREAKAIILPFRQDGSRSLPRVLRQANQLRIIGGRWRGRRMAFASVPGVRPTPDRVRETLFNWLGQDLTGSKTLDLFAGSGALTFEALSRGAVLGVAVDHHAAVVRRLVANGAALGATTLETHCSDALSFLAREARRFDVIFLDPPFGNADWDTLIPTVVSRLAPSGMLYVEAPAAVEAPPGMEVWRGDKAGRVHYHLLRRAGGAASP